LYDPWLTEQLANLAHKTPQWIRGHPIFGKFWPAVLWAVIWSSMGRIFSNRKRWSEVWIQSEYSL